MATSIFRRSRAANSVVRGQIWPNFELTQALMYVIITCKYEKDQMENSRENGDNVVFPIASLWDFFRRSRTGNSVVPVRIVLNFELIQAFMYAIVTCKYEKDPIKNLYGSYLLPWKPKF